MIADTGLIITADKTDDGGARGRVEWDRASFMPTRSSKDYPSLLDDVFAKARSEDGEEVTTSPFPVIDVMASWGVWSMLSLEAPGIEHHMGTGDDGGPMAWMLHADGPWARAHTSRGERITTVHQGGPRCLYDLLDYVRESWVNHGELPVYGARATITPDGTTTLAQGGWSASSPRPQNRGGLPRCSTAPAAPDRRLLRCAPEPSLRARAPVPVVEALSSPQTRAVSIAARARP